MRRHIAAMGGMAFLGACATLPTDRTITCAESPGRAITYSPDGKTASTILDVLTYNIEGLPWPARTGRGPFLREIGERLAAFRSAGRGPDIIVFQEVFTNSASRAVVSSGYASIASGPHTRSRQAPNVEGPLPGRRRVLRGEIRLNLKSSGLVLATDYPILRSNYVPYARGSCAGFDCLSNKGILYAEIAVPGVPGSIDVLTTHMNSQRASRVGEYRHSEAHARQVREMGAFARENSDTSTPIIIAGDFNMRNSDVRFHKFERESSLEIVHRYCVERPTECEIRIDWEHEDPWRRVQNLHLYHSGDFVKVRPLWIKEMFDGGATGPVLSDHNGVRVLYELSWPVQGAPPPSCQISAVKQVAALDPDIQRVE